MTSRLYTGWVLHRRETPRRHEFRYRIALPMIDLDGLDEVLGRHPLWGTGRLHPISYRDDDHLSGHAGDLATRFRRELTARLGREPSGRLHLLAHPRTWGWCFNPISVVQSIDSDGVVDAALVEVTSTPWKEQTLIAVDTGDRRDGWETLVDKSLHVSPFLPMDLSWRITASAPTDRFDLRVEVLGEDGALQLDTRLELVGRPLDRAAMTRLLVRHPLMSHRTSAGIHVQAARLWRKRIPIHAHRAEPSREPATMPRPTTDPSPGTRRR